MDELDNILTISVADGKSRVSTQFTGFWWETAEKWARECVLQLLVDELGKPMPDDGDGSRAISWEGRAMIPIPVKNHNGELVDTGQLFYDLKRERL